MAKKGKSHTNLSRSPMASKCCKMTSNVTEEGIEIKDSYRFENWSKLLGICLRTFLQALVEVVNKPFIL